MISRTVPTSLQDGHTIFAEQTALLLKSTHDHMPNLGSSDTTCCALRRNSISDVPINKISALALSQSQTNMHEHKYKERK